MNEYKMSDITTSLEACTQSLEIYPSGKVIIYTCEQKDIKTTIRLQNIYIYIQHEFGWLGRYLLKKIFNLTVIKGEFKEC